MNGLFPLIGVVIEVPLDVDNRSTLIAGSGGQIAQGTDKVRKSSGGSTLRRLTDLIGSLCDLTSGSGDKGTPIVFIQGYFDNYTNE